MKVWFQNRRMKWRHQESKDRREAGTTTTSSSDVIMQCDVTGNDLVEEEEEDVAIEDDIEEADSTAEITSTKLCWSDDMILLFLELW